MKNTHDTPARLAAITQKTHTNSVQQYLLGARIDGGTDATVAIVWGYRWGRFVGGDVPTSRRRNGDRYALIGDTVYQRSVSGLTWKRFAFQAVRP